MENKKIRQNQPDYITNKVISVFGLCALLVIGLNFLMRPLSYVLSFKSARVAVLIVMGVSAALTVGALVWSLISKSKGTYDSRKILTSGLAGAVCLLVFLCTLAMYVNPVSASRMIYTIIPGYAVLYLIYNVYQREFFTICVTHIITALALYNSFKSAGGTIQLAYFVLALALCVLALALFFRTRRTGGELTLFKEKFSVFNRNTNQKHIVWLYLVTIVLLTVSFLFGGWVAYYAMYAVIAYLVILLVYHTVKLI